MRQKTESVGDDVTKSTPSANAYYKKAKAIAEKH
jgi:hypothetical protein